MKKYLSIFLMSFILCTISCNNVGNAETILNVKYDEINSCIYLITNDNLYIFNIEEGNLNLMNKINYSHDNNKRIIPKYNLRAEIFNFVDNILLCIYQDDINRETKMEKCIKFILLDKNLKIIKENKILFESPFSVRVYPINCEEIIYYSSNKITYLNLNSGDETILKENHQSSNLLVYQKDKQIFVLLNNAEILKYDYDNVLIIKKDNHKKITLLNILNEHFTAYDFNENKILLFNKKTFDILSSLSLDNEIKKYFKKSEYYISLSMYFEMDKKINYILQISKQSTSSTKENIVFVFNIENDKIEIDSIFVFESEMNKENKIIQYHSPDNIKILEYELFKELKMKRKPKNYKR